MVAMYACSRLRAAIVCGSSLRRRGALVGMAVRRTAARFASLGRADFVRALTIRRRLESENRRRVAGWHRRGAVDPTASVLRVRPVGLTFAVRDLIGAPVVMAFTGPSTAPDRIPINPRWRGRRRTSKAVEIVDAEHLGQDRDDAGSKGLVTENVGPDN